MRPAIPSVPCGRATSLSPLPSPPSNPTPSIPFRFLSPSPTESQGSWGTLGGQPGECTKVDSAAVACTATNMGFFDRLYDCGAIRKNGNICGCVPEFVVADIILNYFSLTFPQEQTLEVGRKEGLHVGG